MTFCLAKTCPRNGIPFRIRNRISASIIAIVSSEYKVSLRQTASNDVQPPTFRATCFGLKRYQLLRLLPHRLTKTELLWAGSAYQPTASKISFGSAYCGHE